MHNKNKPYVETMLLRERRMIGMDIDVLSRLYNTVLTKAELWEYTDRNLWEGLQGKYPFLFADKDNLLLNIKLTKRLAEEAKNQVNNLLRKLGYGK